MILMFHDSTSRVICMVLILLASVGLLCAAGAEDIPFLRVDRDRPLAWQEPLDNVRFLDEAAISGSAQFSADQFDALAADLRDHAGDREIWIIDCRMESHGLINGIAVSWCNAVNDVNAGKPCERIEAEESALSMFPGTELTAYTTENDRPLDAVTLSWQSWQTERELVEAAGFHYLRLACPDHCWPPEDIIDAFLDFVEGPGKDAWLHFHCQAGSGRTGAFMTVSEILRRPGVPLEEILRHQAETGSGNLVTPSAHEKSHAQKSRYVMVRVLDEYLRRQHTASSSGERQRWSGFLADHSGELTMRIGDSIGCKVITSDALIVDESGTAVGPGMATVMLCLPEDDTASVLVYTVTVADAAEAPAE